MDTQPGKRAVSVKAAHCTVGVSYVGDTLYITAYNRQSTSHGAVAADVLEQASHPSYNDDTVEHDIMLLGVDKDVDLGSSNIFLTLNDNRALPRDGQDLKLVETGDTSDGGSQSQFLKDVTVPTVNTDVCNELYDDEVIGSVIFCAGGKSIAGKDTLLHMA